MKLQKDQSRSLRNNLPKGWQKTLAKTCGFTAMHIHNVLSGLRPDNSNIIEEAIKLIKKTRAKEIRLQKKLKEIEK